MASGTRKMALYGVGAALVIAAIYGGWSWWSEGRFIETTDNAYVEAEMSILAPKVAGYVRDVHVRENQPVKTGDILLAIDDADFRAKVDGAAANVAAREAALNSLQEQITLQKALIAEAEARQTSAHAEQRRTKADLGRYTELVNNGTVSRQKRDLALADSEKAEAGLIAARASGAAARQQLTVLGAQIEEATAALKAAEADLKLATIDLDNTVIRAPIDGVIGNRQVEVGQYLRTGSQILTVVPLPHVHVVANFKETQVGYMRIGQPVALKIDAFPGQVVTGTVESFAPASGSRFSLLPPENATGNFTKIVQRVPVRIKVDTNNALAGALRPGLSVVAEVDTRHRDDDKIGSGLASGIEPQTSVATINPVHKSAP